MARKIDGETYRGQSLTVPLSADGQVSLYVWPCRILRPGPEGMGGPTIGVDVGNEEVIRYDCHDKPGHWHRGGYDRMGRPGNSHVDFPDGVENVDAQVSWCFDQITAECGALLNEAEHSDAAGKIDSALVEKGLTAIKSHLDQAGDLRGQAIKENLISTNY